MQVGSFPIVPIASPVLLASQPFSLDILISSVFDPNTVYSICLSLLSDMSCYLSNSDFHSSLHDHV